MVGKVYSQFFEGLVGSNFTLLEFWHLINNWTSQIMDFLWSSYDAQSIASFFFLQAGGNPLVPASIDLLLFELLVILFQCCCRHVCGSGTRGTGRYCNIPQQLQLMLVNLVMHILSLWDILKKVAVSLIIFYASSMQIFFMCWSLVQVLPTVAYSDNPSTSFAAKFVHTSLNKNRCSINQFLVSWIAKRNLDIVIYLKR